MPIISILTAPGEPGLSDDTIAELAARWSGGTPVWLADAEAAEFRVGAMPDDVDTVRTQLDGQGIDLNVLPDAGRAKRMLLADMDSTMIAQECIDELAAEAGVGDEVSSITARAMNGELGFEGALRERVGLLRDLDASVIDRVLETRITLMPGGRELVATMKAQGGHAALVSGGFTNFSGPIAAWLGFDEHRANTLAITDGKLTGVPVDPILGREAKVTALHEITDRLGITPADVIAVGDGANDLGMLGLAGMGVALHAKPSVQAECSLCVNHGDLTALLYLQGYRKADFVT